MVWILVEPLSARQNDILIHANWRSGELAWFSFEEHIQVWNDGLQTEDALYVSSHLVEVAGIRAQEGYVLLWRILQSDAPLFDDPLLDDHMYGLLIDGIVIHTNRYGAYSHSSNLEHLWRAFRDAVDILDQQNHWDDWLENREHIQYYMDDRDAFENLLLRDIQFMLGMYGVNVIPGETYAYDTWQQNPWGDPVNSEGILSVEKFDPDNNMLHISNRVELSRDDIPGMSLSESQLYIINLESGWPDRIELRDEIQNDTYTRNRLLIIEKYEY